MEKILIRVKDRQKADLLKQFLRALDFVESVSSEDLAAVESESGDAVSGFFALAGLWAEREITLDTLRQKAWPGRA
ncbi:MAG: hypothetical protein AB1894_23705 [Chloroflexota bacterium]